MEKEERLHKERVSMRQEGENVVKRLDHTTSFIDRMNKLIVDMDLPALFFVFSRKLCSEFAKKVTHTLIDSSETASVRHIVKFHLHRYPELEKMSQYHELMPLLEKGIAFHHSGLLPILKEIVEILFSRGFIKILFATETFAVGINMPTKTVVFTSYRKYDDALDSHRMLTTSEYIQMAGRAGRRGKDDKGIVMYLPIHDPEHVVNVQAMMTGQKASVSSKMDFHYSYILSSLQSGKNIQTETYWASEQMNEINKIQSQIDEKLKSIVSFDDTTQDELMKRMNLEEEFSKSVNAERKRLQGDLGRWANRHVGLKWETAWKDFKKSMLLRKEILQLEDYKTRLLDFESDIRRRKDVLRKMGYMVDETLTEKGVLASEIHEGHPLLMSHAFTEKLLHNESPEHIVASLSTFLEDVRTDERILKTKFHETMSELVTTISWLEELKSEFSYWQLTSYWYDVVLDWLDGDEFVCEKYGIEQGNFVRAMLKLSNIVDEWVSMATLTQDVEMVEKMVTIKNRIVRGFIVPDSLYLRI
jgi:superfamily II RNA helicase